MRLKVTKVFGMVILVIAATIIINEAVLAPRWRMLQISAEDTVTSHPYQEPIANLIREYNPRMPEEDLEETIIAILEASEQNEMDPRLLSALIAVESGFHRHAVSSRGARGLTQITPDKCVDKDWRDIRVNVAIGTAYLKQQVKNFDTLSQALAAYNAGPGRARKGPEHYPRETRLYIKKVLRIYEQLLQNTDMTKRPSFGSVVSFVCTPAFYNAGGYASKALFVLALTASWLFKSFGVMMIMNSLSVSLVVV